MLTLFDNPEPARDMAIRARGHVESTKDMAVITDLLAESYRAVVRAKRTS